LVNRKTAQKLVTRARAAETCFHGIEKKLQLSAATRL
jgi:hypothetical protein